MNKTDVRHALNGIQVAERAWTEARTEYLAGLSDVMRRLLHEAAHNFMSAEDIAKDTGWSVKRVRQHMRMIGLDPRDGVRLLSRKAAEALANNAELMAIDPSDMDLTSPLAYLPMGDKMKRELQDKTVSQVMEIPEVSGNRVHGVNYIDPGLGCQVNGYADPVLVTHDIAKITCAGCRVALVKA